MKNGKKKSKWHRFIPLFAAGALIQAAAVFFLYLFLFGGPPYVTRDLSEYPGALEKYSNVQTGFIVFPEELSGDMVTEDPDFYFFYRDTWDDPTMEVMLQCRFSEEAYSRELERLGNVQKNFDGEARSLQYSTERFRYPAFIAIDGFNRGYEYALLTGDHEITYIYFAFKESFAMKRIPREYLPIGYDRVLLKDTQMENGYSIYLDPAHSDDSVRVLDYTRSMPDRKQPAISGQTWK